MTEEETKEWFFNTAGMFADDVAARMNIPLAQAKNMIKRWTAERRAASAAPKVKTDEDRYWEARKFVTNNLKPEYLASGSRLSWAAWREAKARKIAKEV